MCAHVPEKGIDVDFDYVALDFSCPQDFNVSLTNLVTATRDYYAQEGKYVLVESGYGIEMEKDVLSDDYEGVRPARD